jgi:hypothetical protein
MVSSLGAFWYCLLADRPVEITIATLFAGLFAGLSPRMKGRWGWQTKNAALGGEFEDPFDATRLSRLS